MQLLPVRDSRILYRLLTSFIFLSLFCYTGKAQAHNRQGGSTVTLFANQIALRDVFKAIRKQTGLTVTFSNTEIKINLNEKINANFNDTPLEEVMRHLLKSKKDLTFSISPKNEAVYILKDDTPRKSVAPKNIEMDTSSNIFSLIGTVTDEAGSPLVGATVLIKGSYQGATTDEQGNFTLPSVTTGNKLIVSNVGHETREVTIKGKSILIKLPLLIQGLEETVVKGYYTTSKRLNTGNVSTVKATDIEKQPVSNPLATLQGRVPGMTVVQETGVPGGGFKIQIRGRNSIREDGNAPLYIIDGVPYPPLFPSSQGFAIVGNGSPLNFINPADISRIDVLKDADATAIYGSRGANGVILITTKKGVPGNMKVNARFYTGYAQVPKKSDLLNLPQYLEMKHEAFRNDDAVPSQADYSVNGTWDTTRTTDWQDELIGGTANYTDAQASISGGAPNVQYLVSTGYHRETTVFPRSTANSKGSVHFNFNGSSLNKKFNILLTGSYVADRNRLPRFDLTQSILLAPNAPKLLTNEGRLNWENSTWSNPLAPTFKEYTNNTDNLTANLTVSYAVLKSLQFKTAIGYSKILSDAMNTNPSISNNPAFNTPRTSRFENNKFRSTIVEPQLDYSFKSGKSEFNALLGGTLSHNWHTGRIIATSGYSSDELLKSVTGASDVNVFETQNKEYKYAAVFGRFNYNYDDKYLINVTGRYDGSSRFGPGRQSHFFHAIGVGWIFSEEKLFRDALGFISFGKLRFSYGETGNDQVQDYGYLDLYSYLDFLNPYQGTQGLVPTGLLNQNYSWEVNKKLEVGLEASFLNSRVSFSTSYFRNRSSNQLINFRLPIFTGFGSVLANRPALVQNSGVEILLAGSIVQSKNFDWSASFNISTARNKLLEYPNLEGSPEADYLVVGKSLNIARVYKFGGVNPETGIYEFFDAKGATTNTPSYSTDRTVVMDRMPKYFGGVQNTFTVRNISLDVFFQFVKQIGYDSELFGTDAPGVGVTLNPSTRVLNRWQKPGDQSDIQKFTQSRISPAYTAHSYAALSDKAYVNASFIRLKNVSLSYNIPSTIKKRLHVNDLKMFFQAQNVLTITNYKGLDPETQSIMALPPLRVLTVGVQLSL